jgi:hypothetical protein
MTTAVIIFREGQGISGNIVHMWYSSDYDSVKFDIGILN